MMNFILMTISITVAILLAMAAATVIMLHPKVMKLYMKYCYKTLMKQMDDTIEEISKELEA